MSIDSIQHGSNSFLSPLLTCMEEVSTQSRLTKFTEQKGKNAEAVEHTRPTYRISEFTTTIFVRKRKYYSSDNPLALLCPIHFTKEK